MPESILVTEWGSQFLRGNFRHVRNTFYTAGQDSFSDPPMQNPDLFQRLLNVMPSVQGDLDRRWGYRAFNLTTFLGATSNYAVPIAIEQNDVLNSRKLVMAVGTNLSAIGEDGSLYKSNIFTPVGQRVQGMNSRSYLYFASGQSVPVLEVEFPADPEAYSGTATDPGGPHAWTSPSSATGAPDSAFATATATSGSPTNPLNMTNFGFSVPAGNTIQGVIVNVTGFATQFAIGTQAVPFTIQLLSGGVLIGTFKGVSPFHNGSGSGTFAFGTSVDLWGANLTPAIVNSASFGVQLVGGQSSTNGNNAGWNFDAVQIEVFYAQLVPGTQSDLLKWDGTTNPTANAVTNWGIDNSQVNIAVVGPNGPSTASASGTATTLPPPDNPPSSGGEGGGGKGFLF